jgi:ribosomal protein S18 acetylase RimI-like enzyme
MAIAEGVLTRIVAFQEALARRSARTLAVVPGGFAVLDDRYPASYEHNQVYVTGPVPVDVLLSETDRVLSDRGHRQITVLGDAIGRRLTPRLVAAGYESAPLVVMALASAPPALRSAVRVERVPLEALRDAVVRSWAEQYPFDPGNVRGQLYERRFATAAACELSSHVVRVDGAVAAWCHLYHLGGEAQVESVNTLPEWRGRGFAKAVVLDAVATALEADCRMVFLVAYRDDWPRHLYDRLGFAVVGEQHSFVRA